MKTLRIVLGSVAILVFMASASYAGSVTIRLVEATNDGKKDSWGLTDVAGVLKKNLQYKSFTLIATASVSLPSTGTVTTLGPLTVTLTGSEESLAISVMRDGKSALDTSVTLRKKTPLVLGGFSSGDGKLVLVFTAN